MPRKVTRIITKCVADSYAANDEKIIEFMSPSGIGGLISFSELDGQLIIEPYRCDPGVIVRVRDKDRDVKPQSLTPDMPMDKRRESEA